MSENTTPRRKHSLSDINFDVQAVGADVEFKRVVKRTVERSAEQKRLDHDAEVTYQQWVKAGRPDDLNKCPKVRYVIAPQHADALMAFLRKTVTSGGPLEGKQMKYTKTTAPDGRTGFLVIYRDKPVKD